MRRIICAVLLSVLLLQFLNPSAMSLEITGVSADSAVLYDPALGVSLLEKNARQRRPMASTTKIMTAVLALELYELDAQIEVLPEWCGVEGSSFYLQPGEVMTVEDLLYGLLLESGNDAARALACIFSGEERDFVGLMNEKARELGLVDTNFENPSGLSDENHYSTAYDMAVLTAYAMEIAAFGEIVGTRTATRAGRYLANHNKLLAGLEGALGVKTGYTKSAGRCLVSACERQGRTLIAVTLSAPDDWRDHEYLYSVGFANSSERQVLSDGIISAVPLAGASKPYGSLMVERGLALTLTDEQFERINIRLYGSRIHYGSTHKGERWGKVQVLFDEKTIFEAPVFFAESVDELPSERGFFSRVFYWILEVLR